MDITKAQWADIEAKLKGYFASVKFTLGEHTVDIQKQRVRENQDALIVFIDGIWKGSWLEGKDPVYGPLVQQLWRKRESAVWKPQQKARIIKEFGKRGAKEHFPSLDAKTVMYTPDFTTAASLVRQFKKVKGLTLVDDKTLSGETP